MSQPGDSIPRPTAGHKPMTLDDLQFLLSTEGDRWLKETARSRFGFAVIPITPHNHLQIAAHLRQQLPAAQAQAVLETVILRQQAVAKFSRADQMFFTRPALEQASAEAVSHYRAGRFARAGYSHIADLGCSIGGDALALAAHAQVTGVEWDAVRLAMAQENVRIYGHGAQFHPLQADLVELTPLPVEAVFFDPARRDEHGRRFYSVHQYQPPLSLIERWGEHTAVKISPGVDYAEIPAEAEAEFISLNGEMKECVLWTGDLRSGVNRRATLLPAGDTLTDADLPARPVPVTIPGRYLYEPDSAIIRAHLVQALAHRLGARQIDADIAYLTSDAPLETPFARRYVVEAVRPFQLKQLRHALHQQQIGSVTIKKRGSPLQPEQLKRQLRLTGPVENHRILFLTHIQGEPSVIIGWEDK
ncbi:MAG TPA: class I SAM-dependent methyltransferase [Chloroflexota bacterium]|nr:class I SAM-dependent methyltransferase [Chloroflexota bacterium]